MESSALPSGHFTDLLTELLTTNSKALTVNLDESKYGTFAEIGAGQEVARQFFQRSGSTPNGARPREGSLSPEDRAQIVGGAAGTIAKSIVDLSL